MSDAETIAEFLADPSDPRHGTCNGYQNLKCRCQRCRDAWAIYCRAVRERRSARLDQAVHGRASTYSNWLCRCRPCTDAHTAAMRLLPSRLPGYQKVGGDEK